MNAKHTPAPWHVDICQVDKSWLKGRLQEGVVAGNEVVAICAENQANANLIAAAPELLEAVADALMDLEPMIAAADRGEKWIVHDGTRARLERIRTAIAKATGDRQ